jgi:hypothetical protein
MTSVKKGDDLCQFFEKCVTYNPFNLALTDEANETNNTMLMLLIGIKIAAIMGDRFADEANDSPIIL